MESRYITAKELADKKVLTPVEIYILAQNGFVFDWRGYPSIGAPYPAYFFHNGEFYLLIAGKHEKFSYWIPVKGIQTISDLYFKIPKNEWHNYLGKRFYGPEKNEENPEYAYYYEFLQSSQVIFLKKDIDDYIKENNGPSEKSLIKIINIFFKEHSLDPNDNDTTNKIIKILKDNKDTLSEKPIRDIRRAIARYRERG